MEPIRFLFGIHIHQPVGNFDHVVRDHVDRVYLPLLKRLAERDLLPASLHISGPLLDWMTRNDRALMDLTGRLVADGRVELLLSGYDEPVLAALTRGGPPGAGGPDAGRAAAGVRSGGGRPSGSPSGCGSPTSRQSWPGPG